jgi:uncharacterized damage-inducible protein DinB
MLSLDLLDRLLEHDAWTTRRVLEFAQTLSDEQLDQVFDIGHRTFRETARHMVGNIEVWTDLMAGRPMRQMPSASPSLVDLQRRFEAAYSDFAQVACATRDAGQLNGLYVDVLDEPPHMHRAELLHMLERLGVRGLIEGDVLSWEASHP